MASGGSSARALGLPAARRMSGLAPVVLRVVVGIVVAYHGWMKLKGGPEGFAAGLLEPKGIPAPVLTAWLVTGVELIGGTLLVVGLFTRLATLPMMATLVGAILLVKVDVGLIAPRGGGAGMELDLVVIAGELAVLMLGPGRPSLDHVLGIE